MKRSRTTAAGGTPTIGSAGERLSRYLLPALLLFAFSPLVRQASGAAADSAQSPPFHPLDTIGRDFTASLIDAGLLFTRPFRFGAQDWLLTGGTLAGTALLMEADGSLRNEILSLHGTDGDRVMAVGRSLGENVPAIAFAGALYTTGLVFNIPEVRLMGRHVVQSLAYSAIAVTLMKYAFGRHRPFLDNGRFVFEGPGYHEDSFLSLPSGHTTIAFAIASSLSADIENPWATAGLYSLATLTAVSRMYHDRHWGSDVFLAAALASAIGYGTANLHEAESADGTSFHIMPTANGIALGWSW